MITYIIYLTLLILGILIGYLIARKTANSNSEFSFSQSSNFIGKKLVSDPITRIKAENAISNYINSAAHRNGDMTVSFKTTPGNYELYNVKSWEVDRRSILGLMGVIESNPSNAHISGIRLHLAETIESESYDFFSKTIVITPLDRNGREIIPPNPNDIMGIEYHRPCPKYC
jgi:hypothetical protein